MPTHRLSTRQRCLSMPRPVPHYEQHSTALGLQFLRWTASVRWQAVLAPLAAVPGDSHSAQERRNLRAAFEQLSSALLSEIAAFQLAARTALSSIRVQVSMCAWAYGHGPAWYPRAAQLWRTHTAFADPVWCHDSLEAATAAIECARYVASQAVRVTYLVGRAGDLSDWARALETAIAIDCRARVRRGPSRADPKLTLLRIATSTKPECCTADCTRPTFWALKMTRKHDAINAARGAPEPSEGYRASE